MRLFVAITVPDSWLTAARATQRALGERVSQGTLRTVDPALLHLTLRFIGEVADDALPVLRRQLAAVAPIDGELALGRAGSFGGPRGARVAWLAVAGDRHGLIALAERVERAVVAAGAPPRSRPLHAHLTLARVTRGADSRARRAVSEAIATLVPPPALPFRARQVALMRSHLPRAGERGPRYERIALYG